LPHSDPHELKARELAADVSSMRRTLAILVITMTACAAPAAALPRFLPAGPGLVRWANEALRLPLARFGWRPRRAQDPGIRQSLRAQEGWRTIGFAVRERSRGCLLELSGRAEFSRAEVVFADGELRAIELGGARRGRGIYELARWQEPRDIVCVRMRARACSGDARLRVLFGD
jgi:hypothetical protein